MSSVSGQIEKNTAVTLPVVLRSTADGRIVSNPVIAAGDFQISIDGAAFANLTNQPTVNPAGGDAVELVLTAAETNASGIVIVWKDQTAPAQWEDGELSIVTTQSVASSDMALARKALTNNRQIDANTNIETVFDDDGVTPLFTRTPTETAAGVITETVT